MNTTYDVACFDSQLHWKSKDAAGCRWCLSKPAGDNKNSPRRISITSSGPWPACSIFAPALSAPLTVKLYSTNQPRSWQLGDYGNRSPTSPVILLKLPWIASVLVDLRLFFRLVGFHLFCWVLRGRFSSKAWLELQLGDTQGIKRYPYLPRISQSKGTFMRTEKSG